jgi:hypothetical protein
MGKPGSFARHLFRGTAVNAYDWSFASHSLHNGEAKAFVETRTSQHVCSTLCDSKLALFQEIQYENVFFQLELEFADLVKRLSS